jgi:hypothetical protein
MTEKEFYKEIKTAITVAVNRFYRDTLVEDDKELKNKTIRSVLNEYKKYYQEIKL